SSDLFDAATVRRTMGQLAVLLAGAAAEPRRPLSQLPLLTEPERAQVLAEWSDTAAPSPELLVHRLVLLHARRRPDAIAVASDGARLTYGELARRAGRLARRLRALGVGPGVLVAVCAERTGERIAALLAVLSAGGAYVSIDPGYPRERLELLLADAAAPVV